jgi:AcrR family transcriptional regulator
LTRQDWAVAGLRALGTGGLGAVRVEPLAEGLGATKGSFYWHFGDRAELVDAVLALWEELGTEQVIADLDRDADPAARLRRLFELTFASPEVGAVDTAVLASAREPRVAAVLERVTRRRIEYMVEQLQAVGLDREQARVRALHAYTAWIGLLQLRAAVPAVLPGGDDAAGHLRAVLAQLDDLLLGGVRT